MKWLRQSLEYISTHFWQSFVLCCSSLDFLLLLKLAAFFFFGNIYVYLLQQIGNFHLKCINSCHEPVQVIIFKLSSYAFHYFVSFVCLFIYLWLILTCVWKWLSDWVSSICWQNDWGTCWNIRVVRMHSMIHPLGQYSCWSVYSVFQMQYWLQLTVACLSFLDMLDEFTALPIAGFVLFGPIFFTRKYLCSLFLFNG